MLLRWILDAPGQMQAPRDLGITRAVASELLEVEAVRVLDGRRWRHGWTTRQFNARRDKLSEALEAVDLVELFSGAVWRRVREPFVTPMGTLDAVHLATALLLRDVESLAIETMLTHDAGLAEGARAYAFRVLGVPAPASTM